MEIRRNEAFRGLKANEAFNSGNYSHFREPMHKKKVELNNRNEGVYNNDFMDNVADDTPIGSWSMLKDISGSVNVMRSKLWPGYYFFHKVNTNIYGGLYIGNGCKALDMPFMF